MREGRMREEFQGLLTWIYASADWLMSTTATSEFGFGILYDVERLEREDFQKYIGKFVE